MKKFNFTRCALVSFCIFFSSRASAQALWTCTGENIEFLEISKINGELHALLTWDFGAGGAVDSGDFLVHESSDDSSGIIFLDGSSRSNSKFFLNFSPNSVSSNLSENGEVLAETAEAPDTLDDQVVCEPVVNSSSNSSLNNICEDPNSEAGATAWTDGLCGPQPGGSN